MDKSIEDWIPTLVESVVFGWANRYSWDCCCWRCCFLLPATFWFAADGGSIPFMNGASAQNRRERNVGKSME